VNSVATSFVVTAVIALLILPRRWAALPLMVGSCYLGQGLEVGGLHFYAVRILIIVGIVRVVVRRERLVGRINGLDGAVLLWALWVCVSKIFHGPDAAIGLAFRLGLALDACGLYFLLRIFCQSVEDVARLCQFTAILLVPLACEMVYEKMAARNLFSLLGSVGETPVVREGRIRASGPFNHAILAGTVGAVSLPLMVGSWRLHRKSALIGLVACLSIIFSSASSGPIASGLAGVIALCAWPLRKSMRAVRWLAVLFYLALDLVMKAPAYYLIARIDLAGGSTGYHRAALIESSLEHLSEWWLAGTNYTRHWMATGVTWNPNHTDITNHYLHLGVLGGLPLLLAFIAILAKAFSLVGKSVPIAGKHQYFVWGLGSALFAHATTCISVSYFDQSILFLYLNLAATGSVWSSVLKSRVPAAVESTDSRSPAKVSERRSWKGHGSVGVKGSGPPTWPAHRRGPTGSTAIEVSRQWKGVRCQTPPSR
jgi:hypothetical protein